MSIYALTIGVVTKVIQQQSLRIVESANGRNIMSLGVPSFSATYRPAVGAPIILTEDGTWIFKGAIDAPVEAGINGFAITPIVTRISAVDNNALADDRYVTATIPAGTLKAAFTALKAWLPATVTLDQPDDALALPEFPFDFQLLSEAFNTVCKAAGGYIWEIDYNDKLRAVLPGVGHPAPFDVIAGDGHALGDIQVETIDSNYKNRIFVRFTTGGRAAYADVVIDPNNNVGDGDTVTIGTETYTFVSSLGTTAYEVAIGGDSRESLSNLCAAITHGAGFGTLYAAATPANSVAIAWVRDDGCAIVQAKTPGTAGNSIPVAVTGGVGHLWGWVTENMEAATTLMLGVEGSLTGWVQADDVAGQATRGLKERVVDEAGVYDATVAKMLADAYLAQAIQPLKRATYETDEVGIHPGMTQTITEPTRGLSGLFLVTDVTISNTVGNAVLRRVTAVSTTTLPSRYQDTVKAIFGGGGSSTTGGYVGVISGGGGGGVSGQDLHFGGSRSDYYPTAAWVPILGYKKRLCRWTGTYTFRTEACSLASGTSVQIRLYDITAAAAVAGSTTTATASTTWVESALPVALILGHQYRAEMIGSNDTNGVACGQATAEV